MKDLCSTVQIQSPDTEDCATSTRQHDELQITQIRNVSVINNLQQ